MSDQQVPAVPFACSIHCPGNPPVPSCRGTRRWDCAAEEPNAPPDFAPIVEQFADDVIKSLKVKETRDKLASSLGMEVIAGTPAENAALMARDVPRMADLVRKSGAKAD